MKPISSSRTCNHKPSIGSPGVSLIELIIVVLIMAIAFAAFLKVLTMSSERGAESEIVTVQATLSMDIMNEIRSKRYDEYYTQNWSTILGPESGETSPLNFDDVDDFNGWSEAAGSISGYPEYSRSVTVTYVDTAGQFLNNVTGPEDYKLVVINVGHLTLSDLIDSLVITPGIPSHHYNKPLCLAGGLRLQNTITGKKQTFYGPFPKRTMTFTVDGGTGSFTVDCETCIQKNDISGSLKINKIYDTTGEIASACTS